MEGTKRKPKKKSTVPLDEILSPSKRNRAASGSSPGTSSAVPQGLLDQSSSSTLAIPTGEDETSSTDKAILLGAKPKSKSIVSRLTKVITSPSKKEKPPAKGSAKSPARGTPDQHQKPPAETSSSPPATHSEADKDKTSAKDKVLVIASAVKNVLQSPFRTEKSSAKGSSKSPARVPAVQHLEPRTQTSSSPNLSPARRDQECKDEKDTSDIVDASIAQVSHMHIKSKDVMNLVEGMIDAFKERAKPKPSNILGDFDKIVEAQTFKKIFELSGGDLDYEIPEEEPKTPSPSPSPTQSISLSSMEFEGAGAGQGTSGAGQEESMDSN